MIYDNTKLYFPSGSAGWMSVIYNYLSSFSNKFQFVDNCIVYDNEVKFTFTNAQYPEAKLYCNDSNHTVVTLGHMGRWNREGRSTYGQIYLVLTDTVFYFVITQTEGSSVWTDCRSEIIAFKDVNDNYFVGYARETLDANAASFVNNNTAISGYSTGQMFHFATEIDKILWGNICPIYRSGESNIFNTTALINCSNITQGIVITMNGRNYYTLGSNLLVLADD